MVWRKRAKPEEEPERPATGNELELDSRMDAILGEVREEADRILDDARRRAAIAGGELDETLAERRLRLLDLADRLIEKGEGVLARLEDIEHARAGLDRMVRALGAAADEISFELSATSLGPSTPSAEPRDPAGEREAAIQMAATGATRSQVEAHLREFTEVGDPTEVLNQVFGPTAGADARVPWAVPRDDA